MIRKLFLFFLLCSPLVAQVTIQDITLQDVVVQSGSGASKEAVLVNNVEAPAGTALWRCSAYSELNGNDCEYTVDLSASADCTDVDIPYGCCTGLGTGCNESWQSYNDETICNEENVTPLTEEAKFDFATPASSPVATSDAQVLRVRFIKTAATCANSTAQNNPTVDLWIYDGSSLVQKMDDVACDDDGVGVQEFTYNWTYNGGSDGSEVYVEVFDNGNGQTGTSRRRCGVDYIDWYAETN